MTDLANPYADAANAYWDAGWRGILPLPYGKKTWPPADYTGRAGIDSSYADVYTWTENPARQNIALRLPRGVVGIDVDHYGDKHGGDTLADMVDNFGALPPTVMSTSRQDGISGIRLYAIPVGVETPSAMPGIEFVQFHHRYVVAWPSIHPEGRMYQWIDERTGAVLDGAPELDTIPALPARWLQGLTAENAEYSKADLDDSGINAVIMAMPTGEPCQHITKAAGMAAHLTDRHDAYNNAALAVAGAGRRGCPGALAVLGRLRAMFIAEVTTGATSKRTPGEAAAEWKRNLSGAVSIIATEDQGHICPDDVADYVNALPHQSTGPDTDEPDNGPKLQYDLNVRRKAMELRVMEDARELLATARADQIPELPAIDLRTFLSQPDDPIRYRVDGLWPSEGRVLLAAAAKAGKTTLLSGNLIPALVDGGDFLGAHTVQPVTGTVILFNMEVGEAVLRAWMRRSHIRSADKLVIANLRGRASQLALGTAQGRKRAAGYLRNNGAEAVCLDPLAPLLAALGLDENLNSDVAKFFGWWSETMADAGVKDDLIVHHTGHDGARSRGASRLLDEPDAIWNLTKDKPTTVADDEEADVWGTITTRYLSAFGRDVELAETGLAFDGVTRKLSIISGSRNEIRNATRNDPIRTAICEFLAANPGAKSREIRGVKGKATTIDVLLARLVASGEVSVVPVGDSKLHYLRGQLP